MKETDETLTDLARRCSWLRKEGKPEMVLTLTEKIASDIDKHRSEDGIDRILCTRGAAFRQLGKSYEALRCALESISLRSDFRYAYNLAGASCFDMGNFEKGDAFFDEAGKRGLNKAWIEQLKKSGRARWEKMQKAKSRAVSASETRFTAAYEEYGFEESYDEFDDTEFREEMELITEELTDYADSMERSNDNGWFYSDDDDDVSNERY